MKHTARTAAKGLSLFKGGGGGCGEIEIECMMNLTQYDIDF